jgi:hypothetical protein
MRKYADFMPANFEQFVLFAPPEGGVFPHILRRCGQAVTTSMFNAAMT